MPHPCPAPLSSRLLLLGLALAVPLNAQEPTIRFDVPALLPAHALPPELATESPTGAPLAVTGEGEKIIEVVVPVTTELRLSSRHQVESFRFDVSWIQQAYSLVDYSPKTQTVSAIAGTVQVEELQDRNHSAGLNLNGKYESLLSGGLHAEGNQRNSRKEIYQETPQHQVLVASGTSHRGTGAFFRFHESRTDPLEGGRDLVLAFRVPASWRAGVLKIECRAVGHQQVGLWKDHFDQSRVFVVPIYLQQDSQAYQAALEVVRSERGLRQRWSSRNQDGARGLAWLTPAPSGSSPPEQWVHHLIQSGDDTYLDTIRGQLDSGTAAAADAFIAARQQLVEFGR